MQDNIVIVCPPDISSRPYNSKTERVFNLLPDMVYAAFTEHWDKWFAAPGTISMAAKVNGPFFFAVEHEGIQYPHYGRYLGLEPNKLVQFTWLTVATAGHETVVTVTITPRQGGTHVLLVHEGFSKQELSDQHGQAWPAVLEQLEQRMAALTSR